MPGLWPRFRLPAAVCPGRRGWRPGLCSAVADVGVKGNQQRALSASQSPKHQGKCNECMCFCKLPRELALFSGSTLILWVSTPRNLFCINVRKCVPPGGSLYIRGQPLFLRERQRERTSEHCHKSVRSPNAGSAREQVGAQSRGARSSTQASHGRGRGPVT